MRRDVDEEVVGDDWLCDKEDDVEERGVRFVRRCSLKVNGLAVRVRRVEPNRRSRAETGWGREVAAPESNLVVSDLLPRYC